MFDSLPADLRRIADSPDNPFARGTIHRAAKEIERLRARDAEGCSLLKESMVVVDQRDRDLIVLARAYIEHYPPVNLPDGRVTPESWLAHVPVRCVDGTDDLRIDQQRFYSEIDALLAIFDRVGIKKKVEFNG